MNTVIQNIKNNLPETVFLGDEKFPVSVAKSFILPLARTEAQKDGSLVITDDVNQLKIVQKYAGTKCNVTFYDLSTGKAELVVDYDAGKLINPAPAAKKDDVAKAEDKVTTKQFSKNKLYTGNLKNAIEVEFSDNDIKLKTKEIADMSPVDQINEAVSILTDCELPITAGNVYDALTFFNVLFTPEKFYTIYEETQNDKVSKEDKNIIDTMFRGLQINTASKTMKKFSDKNVFRFVKQFSAEGTELLEDEPVSPEDGEVVENCDNTKAYSEEDNIAADEAEATSDDISQFGGDEVAVIDDSAVKEHGLGLIAGGSIAGAHLAGKAKKEADLNAIGQMKAYKDMNKSAERIQKEREKTKQLRIKEAEKTKRAQAKAASGEDECPECSEYVKGEIIENGWSPAAKRLQKGIDKIFKKHSDGDIVAPVKEDDTVVVESTPAEDVAVVSTEDIKEHGIGSAIGNVAKKAFLNKKGKLSIGKTAAIAAGTAAVAGGIAKAKRKHDAAVARGYNSVMKNHSGEDDVPVTEENVEVCPVCGKTVCECGAPAVKQHSYKNVYRFVK